MYIIKTQSYNLQSNVGLVRGRMCQNSVVLEFLLCHTIIKIRGFKIMS